MPFFGPIRQQPQYNSNQTDTDRAAQFTALVEIIRTEIRVGVDPLRGDIATLKASVDDIRRAQSLVYTREVMDLKLKERDDQIADMRARHQALEQSANDLKKSLGAVWMTAITRVGSVAGSLAAILVIIQLIWGR